MKALEEEFERNLKKQELENLKVEVSNVTDIRKAIAPFLSRNIKQTEEETILSTSIDSLQIASDDDSLTRTNINTITAKVGSPNMRKLLLSGLEIIRKRQEIHVEIAPPEECGGFEPAKLMNSAEQYMWVDALIGQCLDGKRRGLEVVWELEDGTYVFDPETEELREEG